MICSALQINRDDEAQRTRAVTLFRQKLWGEISPESSFDYA